MTTTQPGVMSRPWGRTADGCPVDLYRLTSAAGLEARICTLGATLIGLDCPAGPGRSLDTVLGYDTLDGYAADTVYMGALIGRTAGRTSQARCTLNGRDLHLDRNHGPHHLHGGRGGFHTRVWAAESGQDHAASWVRLHLTSPDGDQGYPGVLQVRVTYTLRGTVLRLDMEADCAIPTPCNLTGHSYFNLAGGCSPDVRGHDLQVHADRVLDINAEGIPTGGILSVTGTRFDLRSPHRLGDLEPGLDHRGLDHYFLLPDASTPVLREAARLTDPQSNRQLLVRTTQPGLQVYTSSALPRLYGKGGSQYGPWAGICLETQAPPDAANHPHFPRAVAGPDCPYRQTTEYELG